MISTPLLTNFKYYYFHHCKYTNIIQNEANCFFSLKMSQYLRQRVSLFRRLSRGGSGEGLLCPFSKIGKKCSNFGKNECPYCGHLGLKKFLI